MESRPSQDRRYPVVLIGFLAALVVAGLLGVPALAVGAGPTSAAASAVGGFSGPADAHRH